MLSRNFLRRQLGVCELFKFRNPILYMILEALVINNYVGLSSFSRAEQIRMCVRIIDIIVDSFFPCNLWDFIIKISSITWMH